MDHRDWTASRRAVLRGTAAAAGAGALGAHATAPANAASSDSLLVGRGISDATGEIAECGLMGYGRVDQQAAGLHQRLRARSFIVVDETTGKRIVLTVADCPMIFDSVHKAVLRRLRERYGDLYTEQNVLLTATHTHSGPGGYSHHFLYNATTFGFHEKTFSAVTDGIVESVERAHDDLAPSTVVLTHGELYGASVNRSRDAFDLNTDDIKHFFPDAVDPQTSLLRVERDGEPVGVINWFPTHGTSMCGDNRLVSADNKGYAAYHWERELLGTDYLEGDSDGFVAAFAQTNAGDMSPNLDLTPGTTPEDFGETRANGNRQFDAAARQLTQDGTPLVGGVDSRLVYVNLSDVPVRPEFTGDGQEHSTSKPVVGASMAAGSMEDGPAFPGFNEGENPFWNAVSDGVLFTVSPELADAQAPKDCVAPLGEMNRIYPWVQEKVPVQLVRVGQLYLIGIPGEVTIGAGYRLRRTVAEIVGADVANVLVAGYSNAYIHYVTTPEEYDSQQYEGGSTLFGRWELPALQQVSAALATAMRDGEQLPLGPVPPDHSDKQLVLQPSIIVDAPQLGRRFGDVLTEPNESYRAGETMVTVFCGAHPGNKLHRNGTHLEVQRANGGSWTRIHDDGDWATKLHWARAGVAASTVTITWDVPGDVEPGTYRVLYRGEAKTLTGAITPISGTSRTFSVVR